MSSPTSRTLDKLRKEGYEAAVVEKWNAAIKIRQDLWGFADVIAFKGLAEQPLLLVQVTTTDNMSSRLVKILGNAVARAWLSVGAIEVHGWAKRGERGKRKTWTCAVRSVTLADFPAEPGTQ